jgi:SlyX protein
MEVRCPGGARISPVWWRLSVHVSREPPQCGSGYTVDMDSDTIERLETKIAFLESANLELSDVLYRQQQEILALRARVDALAQQLLTVTQTPATTRTPEEERPPHY